MLPSFYKQTCVIVNVTSIQSTQQAAIISYYYAMCSQWYKHHLRPKMCSSGTVHTSN